MSDKFDWPNIHKYEENLEHIITDYVVEYVTEFYGVVEIEELTKDMIEEVEAFRVELNEYSLMQIGFSNLISTWEGQVEYDE